MSTAAVQSMREGLEEKPEFPLPVLLMALPLLAVLPPERVAVLGGRVEPRPDRVAPDAAVARGIGTGEATPAASVPLKTLTKSIGAISGGMLSMFCLRTLMRSAADAVASVFDSIWTKGGPCVLPPVPKSNLEKWL